MSKQPEALRLADAIDKIDAPYPLERKTAAELRRLHAINAELLEALREAVREYKRLPHSLGYEFTHLPQMRAAIAKATGEQP